jgi:hypothetical protein
LTTAERIQAVVDYGFTERQARFLVLVMRHAGLCVKRQYAAFAGIANGGEKCNAFFAKLVRRGYASATSCIHGRAKLYHVHHKALYHAIGESDSRFRRTMSARSAAERLMRLDVALMEPELDWLTTRSEKLAYLGSRTVPDPNGDRTDAAVPDERKPTNHVPGTFPIGVDSNGRIVLTYLATVPWIDDFRTFLAGHTALLAITTSWTLRVAFPQPLRRAIPAYQTAVFDELESPLHADTIYDLKRYFFHRRRGTFNAIPDPLRPFLTRCAEVFGGPRFTHLYKRWLIDQDAALTPVSPMIREALAAGRAGLECVVLPHHYDHLIPLVSPRHSADRHVTADAEEGDETPHAINPLVNPAP